MGHPFKGYELQALEKLLAGHLDRHSLLDLLDRAVSGEVEYTGYGFFVSVSDSSIGKLRRVCSEPALAGYGLNMIARFVVFLEDDCLTLETFPLDGESLPPDFRDSEVRIKNVTEMPSS